MNLKEKSEKTYKGIYGLEITTTNSCNYNCSYCFERNHILEENLLDAKIIIKRVKELLNSEWFQEQYSGLKIILWGGEPTMNMPLCLSLMEAFRQNERVCFFIYTNGSTMNHLIPTLRRLKDQPFIKPNQSKITVQVSYDGQPIHDMNRLNKKGMGTSKACLDAISLLHKYDIDYGLKATMSWGDFSFLPMAWDDFEKLHETYGPKIKYSLTVDYYDVKFSINKNVVKRVLIQVAQREIRFYKKYGYHLSNIFRKRKAFCATGKGMAAINTDGNVFVCHGAIYSKYSEKLQYTNIFDKNFINSIRWSNGFYQDNHFEPDECKNCIATSCLRCNVKKFENSKKETHLDKWYDYTAQEDLCRYYKLVGKIGAAIGSIIKKGE